MRGVWLMLALAGATGADWRASGGALFVRPEPKPLQAAAPLADDEPIVRAPVQPYAAAIADAASARGLDPKLLHALVLVESAYRAEAVSRAGAKGLTQLMPATARASGVDDPSDSRQSLAGGARYLALQINRFGDLRLALAAYNAGPGRVAALGRVPSIAETQVYVTQVVDCYLALTAGRSVRNAKACAGSVRP